MRLLVACPQCGRQYDASGRAVGSRFRCHCQAVVTVRQARGHEAAVVRCSNCGAPREPGSGHCTFCGADFTLHERDLDTVCPKCLARISGRANFCHHCGVRVMPENLPRKKTRSLCPACSPPQRLAHRQLGQIPALECGRCVGLWLGTAAFDQITHRAATDAPDLDRLLFDPSRPGTAPTEPVATLPARYRKCVVCRQLMHRRHFGRASGVIIDVCRDHGVWLDADELRRIVGWIRSGGLTKARQQQAAEAQRKESLQRRLATESIARPDRHFGPRKSILGDLLLEALVWLLGARP